MSAWLEIKDLHAKVGDKPILNGLSLTIDAGETHVIMGPNGSGKSTLSNVLCGNPNYEVTGGSVSFKGQNLLEMSVEERARAGIFLAFQSPIELPGVSMSTFMKYALNARRKAAGEKELDAVSFMKRIKVRAQALDITDEMLKRPVNVGFSGGEKKRLEIFQMAVLEPDFCILDEMDSGMDVDAVKVAGSGVQIMRSPERSFLVISHNTKFLREQIKPDHVHILARGRVVAEGGAELMDTIDRDGFAGFIKEAVA
ncbi:MAG: Fe-S cluster assembly ATPase SufC [Alphaproteobacteria bacterium]|nr:Fe-S cluster assembly ATPase SufC [Alphaproteobacteria bacterium]MBO4644188.1 Fe-S cluster assembly ATPase SufC [Alphaproteobacteria bacterium]